jgi:hypothetical protein
LLGLHLAFFFQRLLAFGLLDLALLFALALGDGVELFLVDQLRLDR